MVKLSIRFTCLTFFWFGVLLPFMPSVIANDDALVHSEVVTCPENQKLSTPITFAGDEHVQRLVAAWNDAYHNRHCPHFDMSLQGGGYPMGASRVCAEKLNYASVDLGGMTGPFFPPQAKTNDGWSFQCKRSDRKTILVS